MNQGIIEAHREGILTATTLMATGAVTFDDAVCGWRRRILRSTWDAIWCWSDCARISLRARRFAKLVQSVAMGRIRIYEELAAQVRKIVGAGVAPTHLDTHKHTHLFPPVLDAVVRISGEFAIPWVRRPFDFPMHSKRAGLVTRAVSGSFGVVRKRFAREFARHGCRSTDHFAGFQITGNYDASELAALIRAST